MNAIPSGTYHLVFHDVRPKDNEFTRWMQSTITPEDFERQLDQLLSVGRVAGLDEALEAEVEGPRFVLWFDDAYRGVIEQAAPICARKNVVGAIAVNSEFVQRRSCFWRCELSWLLENQPVNRVAQTLLKKDGLDAAAIWRRTLEEFDGPLREQIAESFGEQHWQQNFMNESELRQLTDCGWSLANHSATHPAITARLSWKDVAQDFQRCSEYLEGIGGRGDLWVIPFDYGVVKQAVDSHREAIGAACKSFFRAFHFAEDRGCEIPPISITEGTDVLAQIRRALVAGKAPGFLSRISGFIRRRIKT
ncbi:MAG: polysaccharide deacetylase family protein [Limisphaerales bacterium]